MKQPRNKAKKMGNPAAVAAASEAAKTIAPTVKQANKDTKGGLSWLLLAGGGIALFLVYKLASNAGKVTNVIGNAADLASSGLNNLIDQINDPNLNASDLPITINGLTAQNKANALLEAMDRFGTDFTRIKQTLTGITLADYVKIAEKFGTPRYDGAGEGIWPAPKRNLSYWLVAELDNDELKQIRKLVPGIF